MLHEFSLGIEILRKFHSAGNISQKFNSQFSERTQVLIVSGKVNCGQNSFAHTHASNNDRVCNSAECLDSEGGSHSGRRTRGRHH